MTELEEEKEAGCYTAKKGADMYHHSVKSCSWLFGGVVHNSPRVARILGEISRVLFQGHDTLRLGARYWFWAPNGWDTMGRPQVLGRSVEEPVHPIVIGSTGRSDLHPQI